MGRETRFAIFWRCSNLYTKHIGGGGGRGIETLIPRPFSRALLSLPTIVLGGLIVTTLTAGFRATHSPVLFGTPDGGWPSQILLISYKLRFGLDED